MASSDKNWKPWFTGENAEVWRHPDLEKEFDKISDEDRATIEACMKKKYCAMEEPGDIGKKKLNSEGRHGPDKILLWAFKGHQGRVYGAQGSIEKTTGKKKRVFFATNAVKKKRQNAEQGDLDRAIKRLESVGKIPGARL